MVLAYLLALLLLVVSVLLYMTHKEDENKGLAKGVSITGMVVSCVSIVWLSYSFYKDITSSPNQQNGGQNTSNA